MVGYFGLHNLSAVLSSFDTYTDISFHPELQVEYEHCNKTLYQIMEKGGYK